MVTFSYTVLMIGSPALTGFIHVDKHDDGTGTYERRRKDSFFAYQKIIASNGAEGLG